MPFPEPAGTPANVPNHEWGWPSSNQMKVTSFSNASLFHSNIDREERKISSNLRGTPPNIPKQKSG
jgi:hypothetical protein